MIQIKINEFRLLVKHWWLEVPLKPIMFKKTMLLSQPIHKIQTYFASCLRKQHVMVCFVAVHLLSENTKLNFRKLEFSFWKCEFSLRIQLVHCRLTLNGQNACEILFSNYGYNERDILFTTASFGLLNKWSNRHTKSAVKIDSPHLAF